MLKYVHYMLLIVIHFIFYVFGMGLLSKQNNPKMSAAIWFQKAI